MKLFEPGRIGRLSLKNRIVMGAINVQLSLPFEEGGLSQQGIDFYAARARGGAGLIITTFMRPNRKLEPSIGEPVVNSPRCISWLNALADAVHDYGAKVCVQLSPGLGRIPPPSPAMPNGGLVAPSPIPSFRSPDGGLPPPGLGRYPARCEKYVICRELTIGEIEQLVKDFEYSARIIGDAEIDAIEIHAHQGYLLDQFMTSLWNERTDKYGGDLDGRLRLAVELIEAVRRGAGDDFPILYKYGLSHYLEGGRTAEEGIAIARRLEEVGVNALHINAGCYETYNLAQPPTTQPRGCSVELAETTRKAVNIPVIADGKLGYPDLAERVLREGKADFISLARYLLADPDWPDKVKEGRMEDVIPCLGCHEGCISRVRLYKRIGCAVNAATGRERDSKISLATKNKSVLVIGGGPGGMEAARVAALRGHEVTLWEKKDVLGGNLVPASVPDFKQDYKLLLDYLITQIIKLGITLELEKAATLELVQRMHPDIVFVASGATSIIPEINGIKDGMESGRVLTAVDLLLGKGEAGKSVVVVGGGMVGSETALHLEQQAKKVTIVRRSESQAPQDMVWGNALDLMKLLDDANVKILTGIEVEEITDKGIIIVDKENKTRTIEADTIVFARGMKPNRELVEALQDRLPEVYAIGDCVEPRKILNAIWEGFRTARLI